MPVENVLEVHDLVTRFYTYDGVVRALEGVSFDIGRGETVGLVGETGCGKSVTALSILKLIPSPPGKIEGGQVLFLMPEKERAQLRASEEVAWRRLREHSKALPPTGGGWEKGLAPMVANGSSNPITQLPLSRVADLANAIRRSPLSTQAKKDLLEPLTAVYTARQKYDLLAKDEEFMHVIRGNYISMIFQEPMSALNPVINAGDQIAENILLHQRKELCQESLKWIDDEVKMLRAKSIVPRLDLESGEVRCPRCGSESYGRPKACGACHVPFAFPAHAVPESVPGGVRCPYCGSTASPTARECAECGLAFRTGSPGMLVPSFGTKTRAAFGRVISPLSQIVLRIYKRLYLRMLKNPKDGVLSVASRVPFLRRYQKIMYGRALRRAVAMLEQVRIPDPEKVVNSYPFELSGGMAQRVLIAIALSCNPKLLIADEPTTALDVTIQAQILKLMRDLKDRLGSSVLLITHNLGVVAETCDRVGVMYAGNVVEMSSVREIFKEPLHPYTKGLMESIPRTTTEKDRLAMIKGNVPNLVHPPGGCRFHPRCPVAVGTCGWSVAEVSERLLQAIGVQTEADLAIPANGLQARVLDGRTFEVEVPGDQDERKVRQAVDAKADAAFTAIESIERKDRRLVFRLIRQRVPTPTEPHPGHMVSCHLFGGGVDA